MDSTLDSGSQMEASSVSRKSRNLSKRYARLGVDSGRVASQNFCLSVATFRAIAPRIRSAPGRTPASIGRRFAALIGHKGVAFC